MPQSPLDDGWDFIKAKDQPDLPQLDGDQGIVVIDIVTTTDSEKSSSNGDDLESEVEKEAEVSENDDLPGAQIVLHDPLVKNLKSKIIHRIPDIGSEVSISQCIRTTSSCRRKPPNAGG